MDTPLSSDAICPSRLPPLAWILLVAPVFLLLACGGDSGSSTPLGGGDLTGPCQDKNQRCNSSGDCCGTLLCNSNKVCYDGNCQGRDTACTSSSQCCGDGSSCRRQGVACTSSSQCCGSLTCDDGICGGGSSCRNQGAQCTSSSQCCGSLTCASGLCR